MTVARTTGSKARRPIRALLVDLDDTLYRCETIPHTVKTSIQRYVKERLGVPATEVEALTMQLYFQYGTTLAGLTANGYKIDFDEYHKFVHHDALDYNAWLKPDIMLRELLCSMPDIPKYILTNADRKHAHLCLARLGISDCFQGIFDFEWAMQQGAERGLLTTENPVLCKPSHTVYHLALEAIQCEANEVMFFDDSARNILAAHEVGIMTCLVGRDSLIPGADLAVNTMHVLPHVLPELMDQPGLVHDCHDHHHAMGTVEAGEAVELTPMITVAEGSGNRSM